MGDISRTKPAAIRSGEPHRGGEGEQSLRYIAVIERKASFSCVFSCPFDGLERVLHVLNGNCSPLELRTNRCEKPSEEEIMVENVPRKGQKTQTQTGKISWTRRISVLTAW